MKPSDSICVFLDPCLDDSFSTVWLLMALYLEYFFFSCDWTFLLFFFDFVFPGTTVLQQKIIFHKPVHFNLKLASCATLTSTNSCTLFWWVEVSLHYWGLVAKTPSKAESLKPNSTTSTTWGNFGVETLSWNFQYDV